MLFRNWKSRWFHFEFWQEIDIRGPKMDFRSSVEVNYHETTDANDDANYYYLSSYIGYSKTVHPKDVIIK